ncbi:DUF2303 family protein, partial [Nocardia abscessus]|uniref:DUF2303 family protein n=1 Tax=Nocardia abscessus TaxID=120957 RepID=UPI002458C267
MDPSAAYMLELAQSFQATKNVQSESGTRVSTGEVPFRYREDIDAKAGRAGDLSIPETFRLSLPIWRGTDTQDFVAKLRYRLSEGDLRLGVKLPSLEDRITGAFAELVTAVEDSVDPQDNHTVVFGPAPAAIDPLPRPARRGEPHTRSPPRNEGTHHPR